LCNVEKICLPFGFLVVFSFKIVVSICSYSLLHCFLYNYKLYCYYCYKWNVMFTSFAQSASLLTFEWLLAKAKSFLVSL
jgi:hypothetical protein